MKVKEIRELSATEIAKKIRDNRDQSLKLRLEKNTGSLETPHMLKTLRREIARLETIHAQKLAAESAS